MNMLSRVVCAFSLVSFLFHAYAGDQIVSHTRSSGAGSVTDAVNNAVTGDAIVFATTGTITLDAGLDVANKNLSFEGNANSPITLNGNNTTGLISLTGSTTVFSISNITLTGGASMRGGAIFADETTPVDVYLNTGTIIRNNTATYDDGGGVFIRSGNLYMADGVLLQNNNAGYAGGGALLLSGNLTMGNAVAVTGNTAGSNGGGGLRVNNGSLTGQNNVAVSNNRAGGPGGGVYVYNGNAVFGSGAHIDNNQSTNGDGGGLFIGSGATETRFGDSSSISGNSANGSGGGLFVESGNVFFGASFTGSNNSTTSRGSGTGDGGMIKFTGAGNLDVGAGSVFRNNSAAVSGGVVWSGAGDVLVGDTVVMAGNTSLGTGDCPKRTGGGAVYSDGGAVVFGIGAAITDNTANGSGGGILAASGTVSIGAGSVVSRNTSVNGFGGGIAAFDNVVTIGANSTFSTNAARCAGGAIMAGAGATITSTSFTNNTARGDSATTGTGGALYAMGDVIITDGLFANNSATSSAFANGVAGHGGAIYHEAATGGSQLALTVSANGSMRFSGNTQGSSAASASPNSIWFGNSNTTGTDRTTQLNIDVGAGGELYMADPLGSQQADLDTGSGLTYDNVTLLVNKTGSGMWRLAGQNIFGGQTQWNIQNGGLHLFQNPYENQPTRIVMDRAGSSFSMADSDLIVTPFTTPLEIRAPTISVAGSVTTSLASHSYGPMIPSGERTILVLDGAVSNAATVPVTSGLLDIGFYQYRYENLQWVGADRERLIVTLQDASLNPNYVCVCSVTGPMATVLADASTRLVFDRAAQRALQRRTGIDCFRPEDGIWLASSGSHTDFNNVGLFSGYDLNSFTTALGMDKTFGDSVFLGAAGSYSRPDFKGGKTRFNADSYAGMIYGGAALPLGIELSALGQYGNVKYNQHRRSAGRQYAANYHTRVLSGGIGLARQFEFGWPVQIRPAAMYEYIRMKTDRYTESGGDEGLTLADTTQKLHRVNAGVELTYTAPNCITLAGKAWYQGIYGDTQSRVPTYFTNDPARNLFVNTSHEADRHSLGLGARVSIPLGQRAEVSAEYAWMCGRNSRTHNGMLGLSVNW